MHPSEAEKILSNIESTSLVDLKTALFKSAVRYARIRTDWYFYSQDQKAASDSSRTLAHNALIDSCNILSRNMAKRNEDNAWRAELGDDRKAIGDFACYLHFVLGVKSR